MPIPKLIFIVPYRDREAHKTMFTIMMKYILEDVNDDYEIYYSHQKDSRPFNRGAMKNLGFLHIKNKYPQDYKNMTFIFNDVDTVPGRKNMWDYETQSGFVKHFYGYKFSLGGIVSITGNDFERINGFPNFWGWGLEDNALQKRCQDSRIVIDRTVFFDYGNKNILQFNNTLQRKVDVDLGNKYGKALINNGISQISKIAKREKHLNDQYYIIDFTKWEIPEDHKKINFKDEIGSVKTFTKRKNKPIKNNNMMGNIIGFR